MIFPDCCFGNYIGRKINKNKCSDTLSFTKIIYAFTEVLRICTLIVKELYMLIIKIHKKTNIAKKLFKVLYYSHYLIDNIFTSIDLTWLHSLVRKLRT